MGSAESPLAAEAALVGVRASAEWLRGDVLQALVSATEFAKSVRRPPLAERPADAVLEPAFELPRQALARVERWKQPLVPEVRNGPRWLQVHFTDGSWARVRTDEAGQAALT